MIVLPPGSWDTHCHIFDPSNHPYSADTPYTPPAHSTAQLLAASRWANHVVVMSVAEGTDSGSMLDAIARLKRSGRDARGVAVLSDDQLSDKKYLAELHQGGVRGVRLHEARLRSLFGQTDLAVEDIEAIFERTAQHLYKAGSSWFIESQLNVSLWARLVPSLRSIHERYGTTFVVDHTFGMSPSELDSAAFAQVCDALKDGHLWVKISGMSRYSRNNPSAFKPVMQRLIDIRPDRLLWGSDAPHVQIGRDATGFSDVDVEQHLEMLLEICEASPGPVWERIIRGNAEDLLSR